MSDGPEGLPRDQITETPQEQSKRNLRFWLYFAKTRHKEAMEFLLGDAKLAGRPRRGWNNVIKHCAAEAAAIRELGLMMRLPDETVDKIENVAFVHDAAKHFEKRPEDFDEGEQVAFRERFMRLQSQLDPDGGLFRATGPDFLYDVFEFPGDSVEDKLSQIPRERVLQYYVDSIFDDGEIVPVLDRIDQASLRSAHLNEDQERTRRLGMPYWDAERLVAVKAQECIYGWLREAGIPIASAEDVPHVIREALQERVLQFQSQKP